MKNTKKNMKVFLMNKEMKMKKKNKNISMKN